MCGARFAVGARDALARPWPVVRLRADEPPFSLWLPFTEKALEPWAVRVVVLLRLGALAGQKRTGFWRGAAESWGITVHVLSRARPSRRRQRLSDYAGCGFSRRLDRRGEVV
jgi:hypothetical protein